MKAKGGKKKNTYKKRDTGDKAFGEYLKKLIAESEYKDQRDFSIAAECSEDYLTDLIKGRTNPTLNMLKKFAKTLKKDKKEMLDYEENEDG